MYKPVIHEIISRLMVGDKEGLPLAEKRGYSILAACKDGSADCHRAVLGYTSLGAPKDKDYYFIQRGNHMALNLIDVDDPDLIPREAVDAGLHFMKQQYDTGKTVFSHCIAGHSRGPTMAMMFLRTIGELPHNFLRSEKVFRTLYPAYDPGRGMRIHARERWGTLLNFFK